MESTCDWNGTESFSFWCQTKIKKETFHFRAEKIMTTVFRNFSFSVWRQPPLKSPSYHGFKFKIWDIIGILKTMFHEDDMDVMEEHFHSRGGFLALILLLVQHFFLQDTTTTVQPFYKSSLFQETFQPTSQEVQLLQDDVLGQEGNLSMFFKRVLDFKNTDFGKRFFSSKNNDIFLIKIKLLALLVKPKIYSFKTPRNVILQEAASFLMSKSCTTITLTLDLFLPTDLSKLNLSLARKRKYEDSIDCGQTRQQQQQQEELKQDLKQESKQEQQQAEQQELKQREESHQQQSSNEPVHKKQKTIQEIIDLTEEEEEETKLESKTTKETPVPKKQSTVDLLPLTKVPLSKQEKKELQKIYKKAGDAILQEIDGYACHVNDLKTLKAKEWVNDEVVNIYILLLQQLEMTSKIHFRSSFFASRMFSANQTANEEDQVSICHDGLEYKVDSRYRYENVRRWSAQEGITKQQFNGTIKKMIFPVHLGNHWALACINFENKQFQYYDSLQMMTCEDVCALLKRYLYDEAKTHNKMSDEEIETFFDGWTFQKSSDGIPKQHNGYDCGIFTCLYAKYLVLDKKFNFSQSHIPSYRERIAYEIVQGMIQ